MKFRKNIFGRFIILSACIIIVSKQLNASQNLLDKGSQHNFSKYTQLNYELSPYTGCTREHWLEFTEKIIAGVLPYLDPKTGMPDLSKSIEGTEFSKIRNKNPKEEKKRELERIMMAVIIYNKATGNDRVPGYNSSITAPFIKAIIKGTDPEDKDYWGDPAPNDQVGSSFAIGIYLSPTIFWDPLTEKQKDNILNYFQKQVYNMTYDNNHYLFHMIPVALLEKYGFDSNREHLTKMFNRLLGWNRGDGWFIDGNNGGFDNYNFWGFQLFFQILMQFDEKWRTLFEKQINQVSTKFFETTPFLFGRDGGPIPWGRSLSYRFADISFIGWSVLNGNCSLPPGQARRIASGTLKYFWEHDCLGKNNLLNIGFRGQNESIAENYISPGDPYWATHGLACLLIPENDKFWTDVEEPIPADGAGGKLAIPGAQMAIRVSQIDGEARLFPVGQPFTHERKMWQSGSKYDQYSYSSYLGFCTTGEGGTEIGAGRSGYSFDGSTWYYRERAKPVSIENDHLVSKYSLIPASQYEITTHTLVGNDGEIHIFWHDNPRPIYLYLGGYGISLKSDEDLVQNEDPNNIRLNTGQYYSVLQSVNSCVGVFQSELLTPRDGWKNTHLFGGKGVFPYWKSERPVPPLIPVAIYSNGSRGRKYISPDIKFNQSHGLINIRFEGKWYRIEIPY